MGTLMTTTGQGLDFTSHLKNTTSNDSFLEYHVEAFILSESERKVHPSTAARCPCRYSFCFPVSLYNLRAQGTYTYPFYSTGLQREQDTACVGCICQKLRSQPHYFQNSNTPPMTISWLDFCCLKCESHWVFHLWMATNQTKSFPLWYSWATAFCMI